MAQWKAQQVAKPPNATKLATNDRPREYVQDRLAGNVRRPDGSIVAGPQPPAWKGLNKPHRQEPTMGDRVESRADLAPTES